MCDAVRGTNTAAPHPNHRRANAHRSLCVRHLNFSFPFSGKKRSSRCMEHSLSVDYNSFSPSSVPFAPNDYVIALPACNTALLPAHTFIWPSPSGAYVSFQKAVFAPRIQPNPSFGREDKTEKYFRHDFRIANSSTGCGMGERAKRANLEFPRTSSTSLGNITAA